MNLDRNRITKLSLIGGIVLLIGLFAIVALVQKQQEIRSKASPQNLYNALDVTDNNGNLLQYKDESGVRTYETKSLDVKIRVRDLEKLLDKTQP